MEARTKNTEMNGDIKTIKFEPGMKITTKGRHGTEDIWEILEVKGVRSKAIHYRYISGYRGTVEDCWGAEFDIRPQIESRFISIEYKEVTSKGDSE